MAKQGAEKQKIKIHEITINFPDGSSVKTGSTLPGNRNAEFNFGGHQAWKENAKFDLSNLRSAAASEMSQIFGGLSDLFKK